MANIELFNKSLLYRRLRHKAIIVCTLALYALLLYFLFFRIAGRSEHYPFVPINNREKLKENKLKDLSYEKLFEEPSFKNLTMIGKVKIFGISGNNSEERLYGMILRTLRFENITEKVENKYGLPPKVLMAMIMQESGGVDLLPNSSDDGGIGLIHMQPLMAQMFGLKTYKDCAKLVCTEHGKELRELIIGSNQSRKDLIEFDDRFHPVLNIDAAGRMLAYFMSGKQLKNTPLKTGIYGYAGRYNYSKYYNNIVDFMEKLNDHTIINAVRDEFNKRNPNLIIGSQTADFDDYIKAHHNTNRNYGLDKYSSSLTAK